MSIYITGDVHGDFSALQQWCCAMGPKKSDIIVILGDVALNYFGGWKDHKRKKKANALGSEIFCIHGNHEMRPEDAGCYELIDWHGGKVWRQPEFPNLIFAKDGEIYDLDGKKVIVLGGAYSVDKYYRLAHDYQWFPNEQPSDEIKQFAEEQLAGADWKVDAVFSHTCPYKYRPLEAIIQLAEGVTLTFNSQEYNKLNLPSNGLGWLHQLIIGGTGTGKSRAYVRPNIYSLPTDPLTGRAISMVITDPKGELLHDTGAFLEAHGYEVKVFNLFEMHKSDCYNPFAYIHSENDVAVLVDGLVANMSSEKDKGDHWIANAQAVLRSIAYYIYYELDYSEANFGTVLNLLNLWDSSEDDDDFKSEYDLIMDRLEAEKGPEHTAVVWRKSVSAKGRELGSIRGCKNSCVYGK